MIPPFLATCTLQVGVCVRRGLDAASSNRLKLEVFGKTCFPKKCCTAALREVTDVTETALQTLRLVKKEWEEVL